MQVDMPFNYLQWYLSLVMNFTMFFANPNDFIFQLGSCPNDVSLSLSLSHLPSFTVCANGLCLHRKHTQMIDNSCADNFISLERTETTTTFQKRFPNHFSILIYNPGHAKLFILGECDASLAAALEAVTTQNGNTSPFVPQ